MTSKTNLSRSSRSSARGKPKPGSERTAKPIRVPLAKIKDDFSNYLRAAADEEIVITRHGRPAGVLIGFASEDDWIEHRLENHPEFLARVAAARASLREGSGVPLEQLSD